METHALPSDETARLGALSRCRILDSPPETAFDDLVRLAASLCSTPFAAITFIDRDRQWVKAKVGLDVSQTDRASGLCSYTIHRAGPVVMEDAQSDSRFSSHALVAGGPQVRFYCGVPVVTTDGYAVGTIAVMDRVPRKGTESQGLALQRLARQTAALLELRMLRCDRPASEERPTRHEEMFRLVAGTTRSTGLVFLQELVETLARSTGAEYVFCLRTLPGQRRAKTVAGYGPDGPLTQLEYELAGTPCEHVLREEYCHYPTAVQALFPNDEQLRQLSIESYMAIVLSPASGVPIGWIALLGATPLRDAGQAESFLRLVAGRAGSELGRELAERQLRKSEERFRAAYRNATVGMSIADLHGRLQEVNQRLCTILGYSEEELLTRTFQSLTHPDDVGHNLERLEKLLDGTADVDVFEKRYIRKDGDIVWAQVGLSVIRDEAGTPLYTLALVQDITERKRAAGALRASEERFHFAIEATNDGMWDWDMRTGVVYYSPQWVRLLGYLPDEVTPSPAFFFGLVHPEDVARVTEVLQAHVDGRIPVKEVEVRLRQKSGDYRWYRDRGKVVEREQDGRPLRMVGTITDITERKEADQEKAEALGHLQAIMETVPDVIFALDPEGRINKWNRRLETVTGYSSDELQGKSAFDMVPPEEAEKTAAAIREAFENGYAELEGHLLTKDGRRFLYHWTGAPYTDLQGRVIGVTGVGRDIVERKKIEQMLAAEKQILELIGSDASLSAVLTEICLMIEGLSNGVLCSVLLLDDDGVYLRHGAGPSLPESYVQTLDGMAIGPSRGSCGTAAFTGQQVIVKDIATHPFWADFRDLALAHGLLACWSNPIISAAGKVLGTFAVYYETPREPVDELPIVARASHLVRLAIERKRTENALRLTRFSIQQAVDAVLWVDAEAHILDVNEAACTILGYTRDELLSMTMHEIDPSFFPEAWPAHWDELRTRKSFSFEGTHRRKGGAVIQTETTVNFLIHEGREYNCAFMRDITERKRAEAQVHLTQFAIERAADMVFWVDEEAHVLLVNAAACERMGYTREELLAMTVSEFDSNYHREEWTRHWQELRATGRQRLETHHRSKAGELYPVEVVANYVVFEGREYNFATVRDISERKRTEALLRSSEERFRLVAEATNDILWDWDLVTNEHWWSPNACDKFGHDPRAEPSVNAWTGRLHPEDREHILALVENAIRSDVRTLAAEYRFQLADGSFGYFLDRAHIVRDEAGAAIRMIGAMIDVTDPKRAYASLEEAYRRFQAMSQELQMVESNERRRLSRELHDEVGQLLTSLKFDLTSVKRSVAGRSKALGGRSQERLARALETTDLLFTRLRQIVRALRPPVLEELGLKAGLEALIADVQARTGLHCSLVFEQGERRAARFPTLETAFYRIVQELLTNVIRHAQATTVFIAVKSGRREWELTVKDDGIGFDVAGLSPTGGFGLRGIRERVEILAGQVEIVSTPDSGTFVHVLIPVSPEPDGSLGTDNPAASSPRRRRKVVHE